MKIYGRKRITRPTRQEYITEFREVKDRVRYLEEALGIKVLSRYKHAHRLMGIKTRRIK